VHEIVQVGNIPPNESQPITIPGRFDADRALKSAVAQQAQLLAVSLGFVSNRLKAPDQPPLCHYCEAFPVDLPVHGVACCEFQQLIHCAPAHALAARRDRAGDVRQQGDERGVRHGLLSQMSINHA